jgi:hypothetical protein
MAYRFSPAAGTAGAESGGKKPEWLVTERVLPVFRISEDHRCGLADAGYLEAFSDCTRQKRRKGSVAGTAANSHDEAYAVRIALTALFAMNAPSKMAQLSDKGKWVDETSKVTALIRKRTGVRNHWVSERLGMGQEGKVTRAFRRGAQTRSGSTRGS